MQLHFLGPIFALAAFLAMCTGPPSVSAESGVPIPYEGRTIGFVEIAGIDQDATDPSLLRLDVRARFPNFPEELDRAMRARGNLGRSTHRFFWAGGTRITGSGRVLRMATRIRYEWWPDLIFGRTRALRDTKTVDGRVFVNASRLDNLQIGFSVDNIRGLSNDLER